MLKQFPKLISLMSSKEKLKCRSPQKHQRSPQKHIEQYSHHLLFAFYPFRHEEHLKSPSNKGTYFAKLQEPGVMDIINRNK